jgi:anti-anti-sigma factor
MEITRSAGNGWMELAITGRLDGYWADHLDTSLAEIVREGHHRLRLDLSRVTFLSSAGIAVLVKFYKRLTAIKGGLVITSTSPPVRTVLDITKLTKLLVDERPAAAPDTTFLGRVLVHGDLVLQVFDGSPAARLLARTIGEHDQPFDTWGAAQGAPLACPESRFALGIGAFAASDEDCRSRFGEFLAVGGAVACLPGDGTEVPDYLLGSGAEAPELQVLHGIACDGAFAHHFRFDVKPGSPAAPLQDLVMASLDIAGEAVGIVMIAETAGLVGASLRQSPALATTAGFFAFPEVRTRLTFTAERAFTHALALIVGVAQRAGGRMPARLLRPLDAAGTLVGHFHAAAFPFHPFKKGRVVLEDTVRSLFEGGELLGVLHLLTDDRDIVGVGQSEFTRGACWLAPLDPGGRLA